MLTDAGITLAQPENPAARADRAQEQLAVARTPKPAPPPAVQPAARPAPQPAPVSVTAVKPAIVRPSPVSCAPSRAELLAEARRDGPVTAAVKKFLRRSERA